MLLTPKQQARTGRDAWGHAESVRLTFRIVSSKDLRRESNSCSAGTRKQGEVRKMNSTFGMARALRRRQKASWAHRNCNLLPKVSSDFILSRMAS